MTEALAVNRRSEGAPATEPRERSGESRGPASERVGESEGRSPSEKD